MHPKQEPQRGVNGEVIPRKGEWPVDPQEEEPMRDDRLWVDGCFDFAHHGHMGAILQARRLGEELYVGVHSDEEILENKGPTVMTLEERVLAADACRWVTKVIPHAPYVTSLDWITHYGCKYVVHGDDITSDASGEDCYRYVKEAGRFKVVKRTDGISTTDLVGRMLLCTNNHFLRSRQFRQLILPASNDTTDSSYGALVLSKIKDYATSANGTDAGCNVFLYSPPSGASDQGHFDLVVPGLSFAPKNEPHIDQRIVYVDGGFDLFCSGHIEFLRQVIETESRIAKEEGWYSEERTKDRLSRTAREYSPVFLVAGIHDDEVINEWKGVNYPIMNIFERGLCVLSCKYVNSVIFSAPYVPSKAFLETFPHGRLDAVYHGPTVSSKFASMMPDPYKFAKELGLYRQIEAHKYQDISASTIVDRILNSRAMYEERQRAKGVKGLGEEAVKKREELEASARSKLEQASGKETGETIG